MPVVQITGSQVEIEVRPGEPVAEAAWRQGYTWPTKCWGQRACMQCFVRVRDGEQFVVPADEEEEAAMREALPPRLRPPLVRLGCAIRVTADGVVLEKKGVRAPETTAGADPLSA